MIHYEGKRTPDGAAVTRREQRQQPQQPGQPEQPELPELQADSGDRLDDRWEDNGEPVRLPPVPSEGELPLRLDLANHSPTGFEWGYGGSGPAQLSLALLADALGDGDLALRLHQAFKWKVVTALHHEGWELTDEHIRAVAAVLQERRDRQQDHQKNPQQEDEQSSR